MNQRQMNSKHMLDVSLSYLNANSAVWQSIAKIGEVKNQLDAISLAVDNAADEQEQSQVAIGKIKLTLKHTICEKADILNDIVEVFALMNDNQILADKMSDSATDLFKMKNEDSLRRVKQIITAASENQEVLIAGYGLTAEQITDLQADCDHFLELNGQPREYQIKSGMATKSLEELFNETKNLLDNQLDNLMKIFKRRNSSFYNGYLKARMVVDY
ncbi:hypothetical protein BZG01_06925 [Labilibaculum manganireducens]|uniref:Uncharacterized protein n=2 Tax=Labilibaculum manganireducens TaxID=1940525 RepID=A0A2N3IBV3_9BACT|nr:hypothetical protein [Labilibaculum manganireducens]PKQ67777.1 hypothetical protein BZG01_06925 [Labilibaculum manganireducens]